MSENDFLPLSPKKRIDYFNEPTLEIHISTLFGTIIDMKVSIFDTIREIKQRIQRVEGIPIYQQNLLFQSKELKDHYHLCDIGVKNDSKLQLITTMKGGPISTRRLTSTMNCDHHQLRELKEILENTRDEIDDKFQQQQQSNTKVSLLIFKNGDILNLLRVIENDDGTYSPYQNNNNNNNKNDKPSSSSSLPSPSTTSNQIIFEKLIEDTDMMMKLTNLRKQMENLHLKRRYNSRLNDNKTIEDRLFGDKYKLLERNSSTSSNDNDVGDDDDELIKNLKIFEKNCDNNIDGNSEIRSNDQNHIKSSLYSKNKGLYSYTKQNYTRIHKNGNNLLSDKKLKVNNATATTITIDKIPSILENDDNKNNTMTIDLPPVVVKKKARCNQCNKRLNITNLYNCRCGKIYCSIHRYSELHQCSYDYKNEGKHFIKTQNPLIQAEKINKI